MKTVEVPMAIDARLSVPLGPVNVSLRSLALLLLAAPAAYLATELPIDPALRLGLAAAVVGSAVVAGLPEREGIWIGTWLAYSTAGRWLPNLLRATRPARARVVRLNGGLKVGAPRPALNPPPPLDRWTRVPRLDSVEPGLLQRRPGGWCALIALEGPDAPPQSEAYSAWSERLVGWLLATGCAAQVLALATNLDRVDAEALHDSRAARRSRLADLERRLAGQVAARTLLVRNFAVLLPGVAGPDGMLHAARPARFGEVTDCPRPAAEKALLAALRLAPAFGVRCSPATLAEGGGVAARTLLGVREATACDGVIVADGVHRAQAVLRALPPRLPSGAIVAGIMRARIRGTVALHLLPVAPAAARAQLNRKRAAFRYAGRHSGDLDARMMVADTESLITAIAGRRVAAVRVAVSLEVAGATRAGCEESMERLEGTLAGDGLRLVRVTAPPFLAAAATSPGGLPLTRGLILTTDAVAACLVPALGTPFSDPAQPLLGVNVATGASVHLDVFGRPNHNALIVGTSGAGKSVSAKAMLVRHAVQGARVLVIDPDSEYRLVLAALGGSYVELGEASLNPLAVERMVPPDDAAGLVVPVLSVMGGEEVGYRDGRPIRRIPDADKAWLHEELSAFFQAWRAERGAAEPILSNLIDHLLAVSMPRCPSDRLRERCHDITLRLRGYTQGPRARVFDRPGSFALEGPALGIGLRELALQFRADLTAAMAVVLTRVLGLISAREGPLVVLVDEAHRVTCDPDAGQVLDQLVRQARKYGAGVWMASQSVDDFIRTELGRILAATAATKLVLGLEATVAEDARQVFGLTQAELDAVSPRFRPGRGVLISGHERAVVDLMPGDHLSPLVTTGPPLLTLAARPGGRNT